MYDIDICTKEKDIPVKYGLFDFGDERELARASLKYILSDIKDIKQYYVHLGFHLVEFESNGYYKDFGYASFKEFCEENIPLDKSVISRCMNICLEFCERDNGVRKMWLEKKYEKYTYSQLQEMVSMKPYKRVRVSPDMTIKEIREIKKQKTYLDNENDINEVATSQLSCGLCVNDFVTKKGIVLQNHIKKCDKVGMIELSLYDVNGKVVYSSVICDVLLKGEKDIPTIVVRLPY